ncbi:MAG: glycosyltransferase family 39 protein [Paenibacillaceae bacterium]|nr:glycosyltransferase family 39 protein [Paenibacillaceae bacterium]
MNADARPHTPPQPLPPAVRWLAAGGLLFFAGALAVSLRYSWAGLFHSLPHMLGLLLAALFAAAAAVLLLRRLPRAAYAAVLLALTASLRVAWVLAVDTQPVSDFLDMYNAAVQAAHGDLSFGHNEYFSRWVYQLGFTLAQAAVIALFGDGLLPLKLLNVLLQVATGWIVYRTAAQLFGEFAGRAAGLLYAVYVPLIVMGSVLTNQHLSTFLFALGCHAAARRLWRSPAGAVAIATCIGCGAIVRPLGGFFLALVLLYALACEWKDRFGGRPWRSLGKLAAIAVIYFAFQQLAGLALVGSGISDYTLANREPYWKFMVGMNPATDGGWSREDEQYVAAYPIGEARNRAELALFRERASDARQVAALVGRKWTAMWGHEDAAAIWGLWGVEKPGLAKQISQIERIEYMAFCLFGAAGCAAMAFARRRAGEAPASPATAKSSAALAPALPLLLVLVYAVLHLVIEVQTRYRFDIMPWMLVLAGAGCVWLISPIPPLVNGKKNHQGGSL